MLMTNLVASLVLAARYAWADNPDTANLVNKAGLPMFPFRTDHWPMLTAAKKAP